MYRFFLLIDSYFVDHKLSFNLLQIKFLKNMYTCKCIYQNNIDTSNFHPLIFNVFWYDKTGKILTVLFQPRICF